MSEILATIQKNILSGYSNIRTEEGSLTEETLCRVLRKHAPVQGRIKILVPYSSDESFCALQETGCLLELVCLASKRAHGVINEGRHRICFTDNNLRSFRAMPDFDMVFCSLLWVEGEADRLAEDLCHCRMLLKPGGQLFLHVRNYKEKCVLHTLRVQTRDFAAGILARAGLSNIAQQKLPSGQLLCSGGRPFYNF